MQTSFLAAKYLRCFLQKGGEACICLWRSNCSMFTSTPVYPQGGETHSSDFILLTPGQKVEPTGRFCLYKINVFLIKFPVCACRRRLLTGVCWFHLRWCSCPNPSGGRAGSPSRQSWCLKTPTHTFGHTPASFCVSTWLILTNWVIVLKMQT